MKTHKFFRISTAMTSLAVSLCLFLPTYAVTLYKWIDAEGNVSYQDSPPPAGQKYEERSYSDEGARTGERNAEVARDRAVRENPITLYRADNCESCDLVETILNSNNAPFTAVGVDRDAAAQRKLEELIGSVRVPTLTIGDSLINSTNRAAIEDALRSKGYPQPDIQSSVQ